MMVLPTAGGLPLPISATGGLGNGLEVGTLGNSLELDDWLVPPDAFGILDGTVTLRWAASGRIILCRAGDAETPLVKEAAVVAVPFLTFQIAFGSFDCKEGRSGSGSGSQLGFTVEVGLGSAIF